MRRAFTLVELMLVIAIVAILAAMSLAALAGAAEEGKRQRARTQIAKLDQLIMDKWNSYRFRQLPVRFTVPPGPNGQTIVARWRLETLRELQRFEMPDHIADVVDNGGNLQACYRLTAPPSLAMSYRRKITATGLANRQLQEAEMLYLIISEMRDGDRSALDFFLASEIGDVDGDGMNEILDPWGSPIVWLRWAPGVSKFEQNDPAINCHNIPPVIAQDTMQIPDGTIAADAFDPLKADPRWGGDVPPPWPNMSAIFKPFLLRPYIVCAGPDRRADIWTTQPDAVTNTPITRNDPYAVCNGPPAYTSMLDAPNNQWLWFGQPYDFDGDGLNHGDNITNHGLAVEVGSR